MAAIAVTPSGAHAFTVTIDDGGRRTTHDVTVPAGLAKELGVAPDDEIRLVERSFEFLLAREPASSILGRFGLDVIEGYFPGYAEEMRRDLT